MWLSLTRYVVASISFIAAHCSHAQLANHLRQAPSLQWKFTVPAPIYASPLADEHSIYFGCVDGNFYAVSAITGKKSWQFKTNGQIRSTALLYNRHIYFVSGDGNLYCLDTAGILKWTFTGTETKYDFADYHQSSPIVVNGILYAGMGDGMYAVEANTGKIKWKYSTGGPVHNTAVADDRHIYFGSFDGNVYAVELISGKQLWKFKTVGHFYFPKGEVQGSPTLLNKTVVIGARDYNVYAINREKGFAHWNKAFTKGWVLSNTCKDSVLYMAGADERMLAAIDSRTLAEKWKRTMELLVFGRPAFKGNLLYVGTTIGKLHGIDIATGHNKWIFTTDGYRQHHLEYFKEDDAYRDDIYEIVKSSEQFVEVQEKLGGIFSTPLLHNGNIYFTSTEGIVYCLKEDQ